MSFKALKYLKCLIFSSPSLDNFIFRLCYRWTVLFLVVFSLIVTCRLAFGDSFMCVSDADISSSYVNAKCYADSTYTLPSKLIIRKDESSASPSIENFRRYQNYYSWVNLMFLVLAFNFYLPHLLWKSYESGYMDRLTVGVQKFFDKDAKRGLELGYLAKYILVSQGKHKRYTYFYIFFEVCNYAISLAQTLWLIKFFDVSGVPNFLPFALETWSDFRHFYFPPSGMCEFSSFSASGKIIRVTALCEMPLNGLFMYSFLFLHAWFILITILTGFVLVYRVVLIIPAMRVYASKFTISLAERSVIKTLCYCMSYSDWFFLTRLEKTMTDIDYAQLLGKIVIVSQGKDEQIDDKSSLFEERMKDFDNSAATSPL